MDKVKQTCIFIFSLLLMLSLCSCASSGTSKDTTVIKQASTKEDDFNSSIRKSFVVDGDFKTTIKLCTQEIAINPTNSHAYMVRAISYEAEKQYSEALSDLSKAIELDSDKHIFYHHRARIYKINGKYEMALADYDKTIHLFPKETPDNDQNGLAINYFHRALLYYRAFVDYDKALEDLHRVIELDPNAATAYVAIGSIHNDCQRYDMALDYLNEGLRLAPDSPMALYVRGLVYIRLNKTQNALDDFSAIVKKDERNYHGWFGRTIVFCILGFKEPAYKKFMEYVPESEQEMINTARENIDNMVERAYWEVPPLF